MASDHNEVKIEIDNKEIWDTHKYVKLNNILPNNQWVKKRNLKNEIRKYFPKQARSRLHMAEQQYLPALPSAILPALVPIEEDFKHNYMKIILYTKCFKQFQLWFELRVEIARAKQQKGDRLRIMRSKLENKRCQKQQIELEPRVYQLSQGQSVLIPIFLHSFHVHNNTYLEGTLIKFPCKLQRPSSQTHLL